MDTITQTQKQTQKNSILLPYLVIFIGYLVFGFSENIKGPAIPRIQTDFGIDELQIGTLLAFNSLGFLLACSFTGLLSARYGIKLASLLAFGSMAVSGVLISLSNQYFTFSLSYFFMYIGNGILEIALAILTARIFTRNTGFMMNLSHFFYGLSSTIAPMLATGLMGLHLFGAELGWRGMYIFVLSLCIIPMLPTIFSKFPKNEVTMGERIPLKVFVKDRVAWVIISILSLGVIVELSIAGWLVNFLEKAYNWSTTSSSIMLSVFFLCFMLGRLLLGVITDKIGFMKSIIIFAAISGVSTILGTIIGSSAVWLFALAGLGVAPIYPTIMALLAKRYSNGIDTAISFTVTVMGIFTVIGNFLIGAIIEFFKNWFSTFYGAEIGLTRGFQAGFVFIGLCGILCSILSIILFRNLRVKNEII